MDMLATDETRCQWSLRVDQLIDGEVTWGEFSDLAADELSLEPDARANAIGPGKCIQGISISAGHTCNNLIHRWHRA
jgi:hypothetical protein